MTELPELPPRPELTRPLPPHGLEQALSAGRRRRVQFLGGTAAGGTLTVVMVAALLASPGGRSDSLQVASPAPEPVASPAATPEPSTEPSPGTGEPAPAPAASPEPEPEATPQEQPPDGERSRSAAASPAPARDARPAYREATDEDAAGHGFCTPTRVASGACAYGNDNGPVVRRGTAVRLVSGYCNGPGEGATVFEFSGGQETELVALQEGREVFRFSSTVRYVDGPHERHLRGGRCLEFRQAWNGVTTAGEPVPAGEYRLVLTVLPSGIRYDFGDGTSMRQEPHANSHSVTVQLVD